VRVALLLVALALLAPLAAARPSLPQPPVTVGPCVVSWSLLWPGEALGVGCAAAGQSARASYGTCALGDYAYANVDGATVFVPCGVPA